MNFVNENGFYTENLMKPELKQVIQDLPQGVVISKNVIPPGFLIINNFFDDQLCSDLINQVEKQVIHEATTIDTTTNDKNNEVVLDKLSRDTDYFDLGVYDGLIKEKLIDVFKGPLNQNFNQQIQWYEQPHLLRYKLGGFYNFHADSENWNQKNGVWERAIERDFSFLIYLNDDFQGGEIIFPHFNFTFKPKKGMFVCFPSDHRFIHKVAKTTAGTRYVIVTWAAVENTKKVNNSPINKDNVIYIEK